MLRASFAALVVAVVIMFAPRAVDAGLPPTAPARGVPSAWVAGDRAALTARAVRWVAAAKAKPAPVVHRAVQAGHPSVSGTGTVNGYPCGGQLPTCAILRCESGGNPTARNPHSTASGLWQILDSTWRTDDTNGDGVKDSFEGYTSAWRAPAYVQNDRAAAIWNGGAGRSQWSC